MIRLLFILVLAALEATVVSLPLTALTTGAPPWPLLFAAVALGWLADRVAVRLPERFERAALLGGALVAAEVLVGGAMGLGPLAALAELFGGARALQAYVLLLLALYLYWRGTRIDTGDGAAVGALFGRGAVVAVAAMVLGSIAGTGLPLGSTPVVAQIMALTALGLLALAMAHAQEVGGGLKGLGWRWLLTLLASIGGVLALATLAVGLLGGGDAMAAAQGLLRAAMLPFALIGALLVFLVATFLAEPLIRLLQAILAALQGIEPPSTDVAVGERQLNAEAIETIVRVANGATLLLALIPVVVLLLAVLILRRRARAAAQNDEERESLDLAASLAGDLRDLLAGLRNPFARRLTGLRAALAALTGDDPSTRARRAYVRLLLLLEGRERRRLPAQTPAEFAPAAAAATEAEPVAQLTAAYEQARYNPAGASPADAAAAEAALRALDGR
jgi:hypothetical protein